MESPDPSKTQSTVGTVLSICAITSQPGPSFACVVGGNLEALWSACTICIQSRGQKLSRVTVTMNRRDVLQADKHAMGRLSDYIIVKMTAEAVTSMRICLLDPAEVVVTVRCRAR